MTKMKSSHVRGDYVFKEVDGNLEFVGDFNGLYKNRHVIWIQGHFWYYGKKCVVGFGDFIMFILV